MEKKKWYNSGGILLGQAVKGWLRLQGRAEMGRGIGGKKKDDPVEVWTFNTL